MLCAVNEKNEKLYAWNTEKNEAPFFCPECNDECVLRKGKIRIDHFAHKPPINCEYGSGESEIHYQIKRELYEYLSKQNNCDRCDIERSLDGVRPDISLHINGKRVAIEIQNSKIDIRLIYKRMVRYSALKIYVLWIIPKNEPDLIEHNGEYVHRIKEWELYLHALGFGKVYYWQGDSQVKAYHMGEHKLEKEYSEFYSPEGELQSYGGYSYYAKRMKSVSTDDRMLRIENDFDFNLRKCWSTKNWSIPECLICNSRYTNWW
jgi:competence protein CoiA